MALVKCSECGAEISSTASQCPHCGKKRPSKTAQGCAIGCGALVTIGLLVLIFAPNPPPVSDEEIAASVCGKFVKQSLRDPDSGVLDPDPDTAKASKNNDGSFTIIFSVRANNGFGGKSTGLFSCTTAKDAEGNWQQQSVTQIGPSQ